MRMQVTSAIVTGGASGFCSGVVRAFAREAAKPAAVDVDDVGAQAKAGEIGSVSVPCDVSDGAAGGAVCLCSGEASKVTGVALGVDGGGCI